MLADASPAIGTLGSMSRTASARRPASRVYLHRADLDAGEAHLVAGLELLQVVEPRDQRVAVLLEELAVAERLEGHPYEGDAEEEE